VGWEGAAISVLFGAGFVLAALSPSSPLCPGWREAVLLDGILCFPAAAAAYDEMEYAEKIIATLSVAGLLFFAVPYFLLPNFC
jgi:hypothetical protein